MKIRIIHDFQIQGNSGFQRFYGKFRQGPFHNLNGARPGEIKGDEFADQGIIIDRQFIALVQMRIHAHPESARGVILPDCSRTGHEIFFGIFGIDAALHGPSAHDNVIKSIAEFLSGRKPDLFFYQIDSRSQFRDRMLHLDAGIDLDKIKFTIRIQQKFNGAGIDIINGPGRCNSGFSHGRSKFGCQPGRGGFLNQLLESSLNAALPLSKMDHIAMMVSQNLKLYVAGIADIFFKVNFAVAKGGLCLHLGHGELLFQHGFIFTDPDASAATAAGRFDHDRIADIAAKSTGAFKAVHRSGTAGNNRDTGFQHQPFSGNLVPGKFQIFSGRSDKDKPRISTGRGKRSTFGKITVARVNGLTAGFHRRIDDCRNIQITPGTDGRADTDLFIRQFKMQ